MIANQHEESRCYVFIGNPVISTHEIVQIQRISSELEEDGGVVMPVVRLE
jgi:hypothetical protein